MKRNILAIVLLAIASMVTVAQEKIERIEIIGGSVKTFTKSNRYVDSLNQTATTILKTVVYDNHDNLPLVGGVISNYTNNIAAKLIIVSVTPTDLTLKDNFPLTDPYNYAVTENNKWGISVNVPSDYRMIDCTNINKDQFFCYLKALLPNTTYYVRTALVYTNSTVEYGNIESVKTPNTFKRMNIRLDYANVWNSAAEKYMKQGFINTSEIVAPQWEYTVFDLVTDEIIEIDRNYGILVYSSNEEPTPKILEVKNGVVYGYDSAKKREFKPSRWGDYYNSCYKFSNHWNYVLWAAHAANIIDEKDFVSEPIIIQNGNTIIMKCEADEVIRYEICQESTARTLKFSNSYLQPFMAKKGDIIKSYAQNVKTNFPSYTNVFVVQ